MSRCCYILYEESADLQNSMRPQNSKRIQSIEKEDEAEHFKACLSMSDIRRRMEEEAEKQIKYIEILCELFDVIVHDNDILWADKVCNLSTKPDPDSHPEQVCFQNLEDEPAVDITGFHGDRALFKPSFYLRRIIKHSKASPCCLIGAVLYLERLKALSPTLHLNSYTVQRLLLVTVMTASKFLEDCSCRNARW